MKVRGREILIIKGDITELQSEAIVNPANTLLKMGGGLSKTIKRKGGRSIEEEAVKFSPLELGEAILTKAGKLKSRYVIHTATMGMDFKTSEEIIRKAIASSLLCAQKNKITSLGIPALGCGTGKFPYEACSKIMAQEVWRYIKETKAPSLKKIIFVLRSHKAFDIFKNNVLRYIEYIDNKISTGPFLTVDGIIKYKGGIVMVERSNPPLGWALPGGFVDYGESVEEAVVREIKEETNLKFINFKQFKVYSQPDRDPRFHTVSVVFAGRGEGILRASSDAKKVRVFKLHSLPEKIAFDHRKIIKEYCEHR